MVFMNKTAVSNLLGIVFIFLSHLYMSSCCAMEGFGENDFIADILNEKEIPTPRHLLFTDYPSDNFPSWDSANLDSLDNNHPIISPDQPPIEEQEEEEDGPQSKKVKVFDRFTAIKKKFNTVVTRLLKKSLENRNRLKVRYGLRNVEDDSKLKTLLFSIDDTSLRKEKFDLLAKAIRWFFLSIITKGKVVGDIKEKISELFDPKWIAEDFSPKISLQALNKGLQRDRQANKGMLGEQLMNLKILAPQALQKNEEESDGLLSESQMGELRRKIVYHARMLALFYNKQLDSCGPSVLKQIEMMVHKDLLTIPRSNQPKRIVEEERPALDKDDAEVAYYVGCFSKKLIKLELVTLGTYLFLTRYVCDFHDSKDPVKKQLAADIRVYLPQIYEKIGKQ